MIALDAYLARIGYDGPRAPTLDTLRAIHALQPRAIAFENLDSWSGRRVDLSPAAIERKLVHGRRGGYCYEQNGLLAHALRALGFEVRGLAGRVRWGIPEGETRPRSHMLLHVELAEGPYLADVGFGQTTPLAPLRLVHDVEQDTPLETYRLRAEDGGQVLEVKSGEAWRALYWFDLTEQLAADYDLFNWWVSTHPESHFVRNLIVTRPTAAGRVTLFGRELTYRRRDGDVEQRTLASADALRDVLEGEFGLDLSGLDGIHEALRRLVEVERPVSKPRSVEARACS
ncbi:N-hydroxyarylamine O-acetyltransferase [Sorangium cellulosum]|uniref:N-hydroxyarylamine O-acetyltransferase n=1 Tax=Sorangium cellulosum TaxID=56 RepID=A0A2L0FA31_SORCE|nr:arylamine N-acetyltransferase [Sorangium cellulosum]AUX48403.1 N-hydroxyarylamine O-acetyltransferase [Sorangium cellulosum]